jgi:hypothetical protein
MEQALLRVAHRPAPDAAERAWSAIRDALLWLVPDGVEQFAVDETNETPALYLLTDEGVFVFALVPEPEQQQWRLSRLQRVPLQPSKATIELEAMVSSGIGSVRMSLDCLVPVRPVRRDTDEHGVCGNPHQQRRFRKWS